MNQFQQAQNCIKIFTVITYDIQDEKVDIESILSEKGRYELFEKAITQFKTKQKATNRGRMNMGLDVYAGTLTRYYTHNWKTVTQQFAEANGLKYEAICANDQEEPLSVEETTEVVTQWRDQIIAGLHPNPAPLWPEDNDVTPYYTDKPDWDALSALLLYIAAKYSDREVPVEIEKNTNIFEHPIVKEFLETKDFMLSLFDGNGWWIPIKDHVMFQYVLPNGEESMLATSALLLTELQRYNSFAWNADRDTIVSWREKEGYPVEAVYRPRTGIHMQNAHECYNTESLAKFAFSILWQAAEFSLEHGVVMLYDF